MEQTTAEKAAAEAALRRAEGELAAQVLPHAELHVCRVEE